MNNSDFRPGVYRHYKGNHYLAIGLAREDETDELVVVYTRLYDRPGPAMTTRRLSVWNETVPAPNGGSQLRFTYVGQEVPGDEAPLRDCARDSAEWVMVWGSLEKCLNASRLPGEDGVPRTLTIEDFMLMGVDKSGTAHFKNTVTRRYLQVRTDGTLVARDGATFEPLQR